MRSAQWFKFACSTQKSAPALDVDAESGPQPFPQRRSRMHAAVGARLCQQLNSDAASLKLQGIPTWQVPFGALPELPLPGQHHARESHSMRGAMTGKATNVAGNKSRGNAMHMDGANASPFIHVLYRRTCPAPNGQPGTRFKPSFFYARQFAPPGRCAHRRTRAQHMLSPALPLDALIVGANADLAITIPNVTRTPWDNNQLLAALTTCRTKRHQFWFPCSVLRAVFLAWRVFCWLGLLWKQR